MKKLLVCSPLFTEGSGESGPYVTGAPRKPRHKGPLSLFYQMASGQSEAWIGA